MLNLDLVQQYESALADRDRGYANCKTHLENIQALKKELAARREDLEQLDHRLKRFTDPDEGQRLKREFAECRERSLLLETAIRNLEQQTGKLTEYAQALGEKCSGYHRGILETEYQRIAALVHQETAALLALAKVTRHPHEVSGRCHHLIGAFPGLANVDTDPILEEIAARLGIPAKIPKAANPTV